MALVQFTRATAIDWTPCGITVNAICPGLFMTEPNIPWSKIKPEALEGLRSRIPGGETDQPEDMGPLAVYLASDAACFVTGAVVIIDGGSTC